MKEEHNGATSEHNREAAVDASETASVAPLQTSPSRRATMLAVALSVLALVLAAVSLAGVMRVDARLKARQPDRATMQQLAAVESRVRHVESMLTSSRQDMVRAELGKMLANLRQLSRLADDSTRKEIAKAEAVLLRLASPRTRVRASMAKPVGAQSSPTPPAAEAPSQPARAAKPAPATAKPPATRPSADSGQSTTLSPGKAQGADAAGRASKPATTTPDTARPAGKPPAAAPSP